MKADLIMMRWKVLAGKLPGWVWPAPDRVVLKRGNESEI